MSGQVVEDDDRAGRQFRGQDIADIGRKGGAIHRAFDHPGRNEPLRREACDEGLCAPATERRVHPQPLAAAGAPSQSGQVRLHGGFVNEHQPFGLATHKGNAPLLPLVPGLFYTGAVLFGGHQRFFL